MKTKNLLLVLALFFLLTSPTTAMLTPSGKDWLAVHAGSADCYQPSGILYTDADGISHTGPTGDVANALYVAHLVGKDTVPITSDGKNYNDFKAANGGNDMVITDVG
ncbi:hypothetical protein ES705_07597 [subsurface metagenome]|nr:hypothetical protein [Methanosarcinales archaeon]